MKDENKALTLEDQAVKKYNIEKGVEKEPEKPVEKEIDGEVWIKKEVVITIKEPEIKRQMKTLFEEVRKGRTDVETVTMIRPIVKNLLYDIETKEVKGED